MDSGGWIALMMLAGTALICFIGYAGRSSSSTKGSGSEYKAILERQNLEIVEYKRIISRLRTENAYLNEQLLAQIESVKIVTLEKDRLNRLLSRRGGE